MEINDLLKKVLEKSASDLHLIVGNAPVLRIHGDLVVQKDLPVVTQVEAQQMLSAITTQEHIDFFNKEKELDFAYSIPGLSRFRVNVLRQRGTLSFAFRLVPFKIPTLDELGMPPILKQLALKKRGLILVTGQTGSGKSTTMAALINYLNENEARNIITIEEPIEFLHQNKKCVIAQREVGSDTYSFSKALIYALRHDPDVLVVGEMRDLATISTAITAAETGHLVFGTLHTYDAPQTIDRMIDVFPSDQQPQIRIQVAQIIEAVISQTLIHKVGGGRVAALEIMVGNQATRYLIREGKAHQLHSAMQTASREGMQILDQALANLVATGKISKEDAMLNSSDVDQLKTFLNAGYSNGRN
jgi:twitching motility protein PilT